MSLCVSVCMVEAELITVEEIEASLEKHISEIPANSLRLPEYPEMGVPPVSVSEAGEDFVELWRLYHNVTAKRSDIEEEMPVKAKDGKFINAYEEWEKFDVLLKRTINDEPPPDPAEYERFIYSSLDWCGDGAGQYSGYYLNGHALALLRNGKAAEALHFLAARGSGKVDLLLPALGIDGEKYRIAEWLAKRSHPNDSFKAGGEYTAKMMLNWIDVHYDDELKRQQNEKAGIRDALPRDMPYFPGSGITQMLRPENGVTEQTKSRIVEYIETKGVKIFPIGQWLDSVPKGAETRMVPVVRLGLEASMNRERNKAASILTKAGVEFEPPTLRPDPRFRIFVNGKAWPGDGTGHLRFSLNIKLERGGVFSGNPKGFLDGLMICEADNFIEYEPIKSAEIYSHPYVRGRIKLPIDFDKINTVKVETWKLTVRPNFRDLAKVPEKPIYAVELDRFEEGQKPEASLSFKIVENHQPYEYGMVSPGNYWLRVRHPGAVLEDWQIIKIRNKNVVVMPKLRKGSSVVVPVDWPELSDISKLPLPLALAFRGSSGEWHRNLQEVIKIKGEGVRETQEYVATPEAAEDRFPKSVIFPYLPPGKYTIESPERIIEPEDIYPGCHIRYSSIEVEILEDSPTFVITEPLKVLYTEKK